MDAARIALPSLHHWLLAALTPPYLLKPSTIPCLVNAAMSASLRLEPHAQPHSCMAPRLDPPANGVVLTQTHTLSLPLPPSLSVSLTYTRRKAERQDKSRGRSWDCERKENTQKYTPTHTHTHTHTHIQRGVMPSDNIRHACAQTHRDSLPQICATTLGCTCVDLADWGSEPGKQPCKEEKGQS